MEAKLNSWMGRFWLPSENVRESDVFEGTLKHSYEETILEIDSDRLESIFAIRPSEKEAWRRRIVGQLADCLFVSIEGCYFARNTYYFLRNKARMTLNVTGNVFLTNDEDILSPERVKVVEAHAEIAGLPEWFASALSSPYPSLPYATGIPLKQKTSIKTECDERCLAISLDEKIRLQVRNTLYWSSNGLFDLNVRQATVLRLKMSNAVSIGSILELTQPFVGLLRFLSGKECTIQNTYLYRTDKALPREFGEGPVGLGMLIRGQGFQFKGWGEMLFRWQDIRGYEDILIQNWYRLYNKNKYALRLLERVVGQGETAEGGIVLMVGAIQALTHHTTEKRYENFLRDLGLESWGIDVADKGQQIACLRNMAAHGRQLPSDPDVISIYWFVVAAVRIYFLQKTGFSNEQVFRIAKRHREIREGLGLSQDDDDDTSYNEMSKPGWIMEGNAVNEESN